MIHFLLLEQLLSILCKNYHTKISEPTFAHFPVAFLVMFATLSKIIAANLWI